LYKLSTCNFSVVDGNLKKANTNIWNTNCVRKLFFMEHIT